MSDRDNWTPEQRTEYMKAAQDSAGSGRPILPSDLVDTNDRIVTENTKLRRTVDALRAKLEEMRACASRCENRYQEEAKEHDTTRARADEAEEAAEAIDITLRVVAGERDEALARVERAEYDVLRAESRIDDCVVELEARVAASVPADKYLEVCERNKTLATQFATMGVVREERNTLHDRVAELEEALRECVEALGACVFVEMAPVQRELVVGPTLIKARAALPGETEESDE